jgi:hypothetical protein
MRRPRDERNAPPPRYGALALAIERGEWERIALHTFVSIAEALRIDPRASIDDLLALLEEDERDR